MPLIFTLTTTPSSEDITALERGLSDFYASHRADHKDAPLAIFVRDEGVIVAGLDAKTGWDQLYISTLYVADHLRSQGIGRQLLEQGEAEGRKRGCRSAWLMTSTERAKRFYEASGYACFGAVERHGASCARYFLKKVL